MDNNICVRCGSLIQVGASFCDNCGANVEKRQAPEPIVYHPDYSYANDNPEPLSVWGFIATFVLTSIPVVGFIILLVWAFSSSTNVNRRNYCRALLLLWFISSIIVFALIYFSIINISNFVDALNYWGLFP